LKGQGAYQARKRESAQSGFTFRIKLEEPDRSPFPEFLQSASKRALLDKHADKITSAIVTMGAALKFCAIAEGKAEISYRESTKGPKNGTSPRGRSSFKEAGGLILKHDGSEYAFNREDVYNREGYVLANRKVNILL
jgi:3'-phosphoadenosine 5'-phosphosulfate (PAPS) 3'-phosphatase